MKLLLHGALATLPSPLIEIFVFGMITIKAGRRSHMKEEEKKEEKVKSRHIYEWFIISLKNQLLNNSNDCQKFLT